MTETPPPAAPQPAGAQQQSNGKALAGMILGIAALAMIRIWWISIPAAIVGLILSNLGGKKAKEIGVGKGMAKAGLIMSVIALALTVLIVILGVIGFALFRSQIEQIDMEQSLAALRYLA